MTGILRRLAVILWAAFGFVGIGALSASFWLERELAPAGASGLNRTGRARPVVQFVDADQRVERDCPAVFRPTNARDQSVREGDDAEERRHMLRISQILTLIEAGVATPEIEREFCAEVETLSAAAYDRLMAVHPVFGQATAQVCKVIPPANDADVEEE